MILPGRTLVPALLLATAVAVGAPPPARPEPDATGSAPARPEPDTTELRRSQETLPAEKRPVRVILPSPYPAKR
jgi:hypothetical protein